MKNDKVRVYVKGKGFADVTKRLLSQILHNDAVKTFTVSALKKGAEVGGEKLGEVLAKKITEKVLPAKIDVRNTLDDLEMKVKSDIEKYNQVGNGYKIIR